jgi:hypothetical protein
MGEARRIPPVVAEVFDALTIRIHLLHGRWAIYRQLFAESQRRFELLDQSASGFFKVIYGLLHDEVLISLCKLNEPAKSREFENLSLWQLHARLKQHGDASLADQTLPLLERYSAKCKDFRAWRDKQLAHLDLTVSLKGNSELLPGISRQMVEEALAHVREFMNTIEAHYAGSTSGYEHFWMTGDGEALVATLKYGLRYEELLQEGVVEHGDWRRSAWHDA